MIRISYSIIKSTLQIFGNCPDIFYILDALYGNISSLSEKKKHKFRNVMHIRIKTIQEIISKIIRFRL